MTRATRADGRPAFENAPRRLRQSHIDKARQFRVRYEQMRAEEAELSQSMGVVPEPNFFRGLAHATVIMVGFYLICAALWLI